MSGCQSEWCLSSQFSITQASNILQCFFRGKKCFQATPATAYGETAIKWTEWITAHSCVGPFAPLTEFEGSLEGINICPLLSRTTVWLFVIQWSSTEVNGTKQVSACLVCLCRAKSLIYHSGDVYRLQFQDYKRFLVAKAVSMVGLNRARRHSLNFGFCVFLWPQEAVTNSHTLGYFRSVYVVWRT